MIVPNKDAFYFNAKLKKGKNTLATEYDANLEYNRYGFVKNYKLEYSLYPSKSWKSFGPITVHLNLGKDLKMTSSNLGNPNLSGTTAVWGKNKMRQNNLEISVTPKENSIGRS